MKQRKFTHGVTLFLSSEMYEDVKNEANIIGISISELIREAIWEYFQHRDDECEQQDEIA